MTTSPALKYGSKGWEDTRPAQTVSFDELLEEEHGQGEEIEWHRGMVDWRRFSPYLDVDPADILRRVLEQQ